MNLSIQGMFPNRKDEQDILIKNNNKSQANGCLESIFLNSITVALLFLLVKSN